MPPPRVPRQQEDRQEEEEVGEDNGEAEVEEVCERRRGGHGDRDKGGVDEWRGEGEEAGEVGEEGWVVECPLGGGVGVPLLRGEGVGEGEPVAVYIEVGGAVGGNEEELHAGGGGEGPGRRRRRRRRRRGGGAHRGGAGG